MDKLPVISVIIPCFNVPRHNIETALASIYAQTFNHFEVIVVDDGSQKEYHNELVAACEGRPNLRLITQPNAGVSTARNTGVQQAQGEYVAFLDADDMVTDDFLQRAYDYAHRQAADFVIGGVTAVDTLPENGRMERNGDCQWRLYTQPELEMLKSHFLGPEYLLRYSNGYIGRGPVARLLRTETAKDHPFNPKLTVGEDLVWNLQLLSCCQRVCAVHETWYYYWANSASATHRLSPKIVSALEAQFNAIQLQVDLTKEKIYLSYTDKAKENFRQAWNLWLNHQRKNDRRAYRKSIRAIYTREPWRVLGEKRLFRLSSMKGRLFVLAYRLRLLFFYFSIKERMKRR